MSAACCFFRAQRGRGAAARVAHDSHLPLVRAGAGAAPDLVPPSCVGDGGRVDEIPHPCHRVPGDGWQRRQESRLMKTMTGQQLGGPCDYPLPGDPADEAVRAQDSHVKEMVAGGDETHQYAREVIKGEVEKSLISNGVL